MGGDLADLNIRVQGAYTGQENFDIYFSSGWRVFLSRILYDHGLDPNVITAGMDLAANIADGQAKGVRLNVKRRTYTMLDPLTPEANEHRVVTF